MAVKPEIIKARLKALFPKANLSQKRLDALAAKLAPMPADNADDAAVDAVLNQANDFMSFEEIAKEDDRVRTLEAKANPTPAPAPAPEPTPAPTPAPAPANPNDDTPAWAKSLIESNQKLTADLEAIKTGKITEIKKQTAQTVFEASEILKGLKPEIKTSWLNRIDVNAETPIEDQVKSLETEFTEIRQEIASSTRYAGAPPSFSDNNNAPSADDVKAVVDALI
jgi:hypothetical protein